MKNTIVRLISLMLISVLMIFCVACNAPSVSDKSEMSEEQSQITQDESLFVTERATNTIFDGIPGNRYDEIDSVDLEGAQISVLYTQHSSNLKEWYKTELEDELDEAIARRNSYVEQKLNTKVVWTPIALSTSDYSEYSASFFDKIASDVNSGKHEYDISANLSYATTSATIRGYNTNLLDEYLFPYFNFYLPCWNSSLISENTNYNDQLYYVAGDITTSLYNSASVIWCNRTLYDQKKQGGDPEDIQSLAIEGGWTYEALHRWTSAFYEDNGSVANQKDTADTYALVFREDDELSCTQDVFKYAWELEFVKTNVNKTHSLNVSGNKKIEDAVLKYRNIFGSAGVFSTDATEIFADGRAIFYMDRLYADDQTNASIRNMDDVYGLMPMPKYDIDQKDYATAPNGYFTLVFVLDHADSKTPTKGDAVSAYLQIASEKSYDEVREYYFVRVVRYAYNGVDESFYTAGYKNSIPIFNLIVNNIKLDGCNVFAQDLESVNYLWREATQTGETVEDVYLKDKNAPSKALKDFDKCFGIE